MRSLLVLCTVLLAVAPSTARAQKIHIAFLWHMHQPIYWPGESVVQTEANARYPFSVVDVHLQRSGPYTNWPWNAVQKGIAAGLPYAGAQVSLSASLMENLDALAATGIGFGGWTAPWIAGATATTTLGTPRIDLVGFGYHHPLMGLIPPEDVTEQILRHRDARASRIGGADSRGIFPPENAFHPRMIPALRDAGLQWVMVDNVHFERATTGYPYSTASNLAEPNLADVRNPNPGDWVSLSGVWAPTPISAGWGHRPHHVEWIDPSSGVAETMIAVPTSRYLGNEDGRGGFGALDYDGVLSQLESHNTDPDHPILVVLHHDGDNYGGGSDSYYGSNFDAFVAWLQANPTRFEWTTVQDYLDRFPPAPSDVIHVESGSWSGADNGDPEFKKWLADPAADGYSPDIQSWGVLTAARNHLRLGQATAPASPQVAAAHGHILNAQASDYWYWDGSLDGVWDSQPTRAAELALAELGTLVDGATDTVGPEVFVPQREAYNPGATEWNTVQPADFEVWTLCYDTSGLASVILYVREDLDGAIPLGETDNATYAGGPSVGAWQGIAMSGVSLPVSRTDPLPSQIATRYGAMVTGRSDVLLDFYVEAVDSAGNTTRSAIDHVYVGDGTPGSGAGALSWEPTAPGPDDPVVIRLVGSTQGAKLHWGVDGFAQPTPSMWPPNTVLFNGTGPAVETPFVAEGDTLVVRLGPFGAATPGHVDFVLHYDDDRWDNNGGADYRIDFHGGATPTWVLDGALDAGATAVSGPGDVALYVGYDGQELYLATDAASGLGEDVFLLVAESPGFLNTAMWGKSGLVATPDAYVGNESSNGWAGWFEDLGKGGVAAGTTLEATLDLGARFGHEPQAVYVAVARYGNLDGGTLVAQFPSGNADGNIDPVEYWRIDLGATDAPRATRTSATLHAAVPNPFNPTTRLSFELQEATILDLGLYDVRGRRVATLRRGRHEAGAHELTVDLRGHASGVYLARLAVGGELHTTRLVLVK